MKKIFCLVLSVIMLISPMTVLGEESESVVIAQETSQDVTPVVVVPGVGASALYLNPNTDEQTSAFSFSTSQLLKELKKTHLVRDVLKMIRGKEIDISNFIDSLSEICDMFIDVTCDSDGNSVGNVGIDTYWEDNLSNHLDYLDSRASAEPAVCKAICDEIGAENVWIFNYDFRLDVVTDSDNLSEFIDKVKEQSGSDKVTLVSCSLGTCVVSSYIDRYKDKDDIERSIFLNGAFQGTAVAAAFGKDLTIDKESVFNYLELLSEYCMLDTVDYGTILKWLNKFDKTVDNALDFLIELTGEDYIDELYSEVLLKMIGNMPSLWECIAYDDFDKAIETGIELGFLDTNSGLYEQITTYHEIQGRLEDNLNELKEKGVEIAIVAGYGLPSMPFTSYADLESDMLIDTNFASFGATVATLGSTLENATSNDGLVDSSTCAFEENTWFIKGVQHMEFQYDTDTAKFVGYLCTTTTALNVDDIEADSDYAQFMKIDKEYVMTNV